MLGFKFVEAENIVNLSELHPGDVYQIVQEGYTKLSYIVLDKCPPLKRMFEDKNDDDILSLNCEGEFIIAKNSKTLRVIKVGSIKMHD